MKISLIKLNPNNPRIIKDHKFKLLVKSLKEDLFILEGQPILIDETNTILAGNMRYKALQKLGYTEIPDKYIHKYKNLTLKQKEALIIKTNILYGEWDYDILGDYYNLDQLSDYGMDVLDDETYTRKIKPIKYEPSKIKPDINELCNDEKSETLIKNIKESNIGENEKLFLIKASKRHQVFNYQLIADYYSNSSKEVQELMEDSALVIIDYDKAIEKGFAVLTKYLMELQEDDE